MCEVCIEPFNKSTRAPVKCQFCPFRVCSGCTERYLLDTTEDAHCMACRRPWSRENLVDNLSQKFVTKVYKARRENLLFEREKSLMPATQPFVEVELKVRQLTKEIANNRHEHTIAVHIWNQVLARPIHESLWPNLGITSQFDERVERHRQAREHQKTCNSILVDIQFLEWHQGRLLELLHGGSLERERRQFVRACPVENCRGFLSTVWKCGVCENWTCPECHEVKGARQDTEHVCDPNNVATARMLDRDSRNCPKCAALIFKIDGCDQMFCTQCHTAFSWRTGRIETGTIHNPHYLEIQRRLGTLPRAHGDIPCGGFPDWPLVLRMVTGGNGQRHGALIRSAYQTFGHAYHVILPRYHPRNHQQDNRDLRIKFMVGDFSEDEFKKKIQQKEKAAQRRVDIRMVLDMFTTVLNDLFQSFVQTGDILTLIESLTELRDHVNTTMGTVSKRWGNCAVPTINEFYAMR